MTIFFIVFLIVYSATNYYIFIHGWHAIALFPFLKPFYIIIFLLAASGYIIAKIAGSKIPEIIYDILLWSGSFWFAFMLYFFLFILLIDLTNLLNRFFTIYPTFITANYSAAKFVAFIVVLSVSIIIIIVGFINTRNIKINHAEINIPKKSSMINELNVVLVGDFHLTLINGGLLNRVVEKINSLDADIVLMTGDILDDNINILKRDNIGKDLSKIKSKYGVFVSNGNHEFINGADELDKYMEEMGLSVIRDSSVFIENSFYVVGRDDRSKINFTGKQRKSLKEILTDINKNYPVILLDHTPSKLGEAVNENIDLQLSGHTHNGQMFPVNFITKWIYEISWGYLKKEQTQFYVTCGVGTWGPPVRLGSDSEIVNLKLKFLK